MPGGVTITPVESKAELDRFIRGALEGAHEQGDRTVRHLALVALARVAARDGSGEDPAAGVQEVRSLLLRKLAGGATVTGPAILEDLDSTTVMLPGDVARLSEEGHLIIDIAKEGTP